MTYCEADSSESAVALPDDIPKDDIMGLHIETKSDTAWLITNWYVFSNAATLQTLFINVTKPWQISDELQSPELKSKLINTLFFATKIDSLFINYYKEFNTQNYNKWALPSRLIRFYLNNSMMDFDLNSCNDLEQLHMTNGLLNKMPNNKGLHYLKELNLRNNPLHDFTVADIASFCLLDSLVLEHTEIGACQCLLLKEFIDEKIKKSNPNFKLKGDLNCNNANGVDCSEYTLNEANRLRSKCFFSVFWNYFIIIAVVITILVGFCLFGWWTYFMISKLAAPDEEPAVL